MSGMPTISVTELVTAFKEIVESTLPPVCVEAEISNCKRSAAGHVYLTLKDENSEIGAVIWRSTAERLKFRPKDGLQVLATGSLQVYVARGTCQFIITKLQPQGVGELELALRQLKEKLELEGLFAPERKRSLPRFPRRIALVTSPTSAAVKDMIQVMTRRWPSVNLIIVPVPVQGDQAAPRIAAGLRAAAKIPDVDVIITGRGGGSLEDLWPFNEEGVARAIAASPIPVVSAVGHEIDVSIADLVADRRALTPSEAGELVVPSADEFRQDLRNTASRIYRVLTGRVERLRLTLQAIESRSIFQRPTTLIDERRQRCDDLGASAERAMRLKVERLNQQLATTAAALDALSPIKVLARGYSLTTKADGILIRSVADVAEGTELETRLPDGMVRSEVIAVATSEP
ncbi:Exodeoxyribonuclease 7 large subunit [Fuerstiella marisgermanici]|uniref:Exodeoxyribonuclease 7 large subunit n=2 Tax=Fuerstiella marisgermanici TaxID=1891926 RepID=A0A1P8WRL8_9PLAN|nr:Exodeoxyribonuclease 7 large subunit [Fuerstiella marisgermanici]